MHKKPINMQNGNYDNIVLEIIMHCYKNLYVVVISSHNFGISSDGGVTEMCGL
jgi:hypothetical protein